MLVVLFEGVLVCVLKECARSVEVGAEGYLDEIIVFDLCSAFVFFFWKRNEQIGTFFPASDFSRYSTILISFCH